MSPPSLLSVLVGGHVEHSENVAAVPLAGGPAGCVDMSMSASAAEMDYYWLGSVQLSLGDMYSVVASPAVVEISSTQVRAERSIRTEAGLEARRPDPVEGWVTGGRSEGNHHK